MRTLEILVGAWLCIWNTAFAANPTASEIRSAAEKGIALLQQSQKNWKQGCYSCHQQALPELALDAARRHGIPVNEDMARVSAARGFAFLADLDRAVQFTHLIDPAMSEGYILAGAYAAGVQPSLTTAVYARLIARRQKPDGHWDTLDVRPPQSYSQVTATANALHAIRLYSDASQETDIRSRTERARQWIGAQEPKTD